MAAEFRSNKKNGGSAVALRVLLAAFLFAALGLLGFALTRALTPVDAAKGIFRMVTLPLCAFAGGFLSLLFFKRAAICLATGFIVNAVLFLIICGPGWSVLLWSLLYLVSLVIGLLISYIALTHKT